MNDWSTAQDGEAEWWGDCVNTYQEESKQIGSVIPLLGLPEVSASEDLARGRYPVFDLKGTSVIDIGGGPVSILLKCVNIGNGSAVLDPCPYPQWVWDRYQEAGLQTLKISGEELKSKRRWDQAWIYNVLQHVGDPERVVAMARTAAKTVKLIEWVDIPTDELHAHSLNLDDLNRWLGVDDGTVEWNPRHQASMYSGIATA